MPLVTIDSNIVDEFATMLDVEPEIAEAMESLSPPPDEVAPKHHAAYWLIALGNYWRSCVYTFSDTLYYEINAIPDDKAPKKRLFFGVATEIREHHPPELRIPDPKRRPSLLELERLGLSHADALHVADAVSLDADYFLTRDRGILKRNDKINSLHSLQVMTPDEFLILAVKSGAPWPAHVSFPSGLEAS